MHPPITATMTNAVIIKTRKFKKNPLLARKQVCILLASFEMSWRETHFVVLGLETVLFKFPSPVVVKVPWDLV